MPENTKIIGFEIDKEDCERFEGICQNQGYPPRKGLLLLIKMVNAGKIGLGEGCPFRYERFVEACDNMGVDYQEAIDNTTQLIYRGKICQV